MKSPKNPEERALKIYHEEYRTIEKIKLSRGKNGEKNRSTGHKK